MFTKIYELSTLCHGVDNSGTEMLVNVITDYTYTRIVLSQFPYLTDLVVRYPHWAMTPVVKRMMM